MKKAWKVVHATVVVEIVELLGLFGGLKDNLAEL